MSEQNINEESYEIDLNDMSESNGSSTGGLVGKSSVKEVIDTSDDKQNVYVVIIAPYISDISAELCEKSDIGYIL